MLQNVLWFADFQSTINLSSSLINTYFNRFQISIAANARERARMRVLSRAFCRLKTTLPWVPADTKLSKLDTLRLATTYIGHLRTVLVEGSSGRTSPLPSHPVMVIFT